MFLIFRECHICKEIYQNEEDLMRHHSACHSELSLEAGNVFKAYPRPPVRKSPHNPLIPKKSNFNFAEKLRNLETGNNSTTSPPPVSSAMDWSDSESSGPVAKVN